MSVHAPARPAAATSTAMVSHLHPYQRAGVYATDVARTLGTLPLRLFLGLTFVYAAIDKIADPGFLDPGSGGAYLGTQLQGFVSSSPVGVLIETIALPRIQLVGISIIATELVVGLLVVAGVFTRIAAVVGALLSLTLFLSLSWNIQPYFLGPDSIYSVAWITLALVGDGGALSLEPGTIRRRLTFNFTTKRLQVVLLAVGAATVGLIWLLAILPKPV